jgi:type IV pilus biogenesis protein CpaD/CtpE
MVMSSIERGKRVMKTIVKIGLLAMIAGGVLAGCASNGKVASADERALDGANATFGRAVHQNLVAQIADPDPAWKNSPPPNTDGKRLADRAAVYATPSKSQSSDFGGISGN